MDDSLYGLLALLGLIAVNAVLTMAYAALINAQKPVLKEWAESGRTSAEHAYTLSSDATRLLSSQQIVDLVLHFAIAVTAAATLVPPLHDELAARKIGPLAVDLIAFGGVMLVVALVTLVFGELLPTTIAMGHANGISLRVTRLVGALVILLAPVLRLLQWISRYFAAPFVGLGQSSMVTEEEIKMMVDAGQEGGAIEDEEKEMIYSIFQFGDTVAREVMVPRIDMVAIDIKASLDEALTIITQAGHSRIPVYEESIDHIRGLLYAKDLLEVLRAGSLDRPIADLLRPAHFVPESKKAGDLLTELQQRKIHLAIVVDEYGGTAGLVTLEDLIEEIVGEIRDEYDLNEEEVYQRISDTEVICDASIDLDDLNRLLDLNLPTDESDTLGGYIFSQLGKVPQVGETLETDQVHIEVLGVNDRRIRKIRLTRLIPAPEESGEDDKRDIREEPAAEAD